MTSTVLDSVVALDGSRTLAVDHVGGKAFSLNRMQALGMPVPPAFALTVDLCEVFHERGRALPDDVWAAVRDHVARLEQLTGHTFGGESPLLLSVRSGAARSMPGMMDTILNLGLTPALRDALAAESGDATWADDTWHRFVESYTSIVGTPPPDDPHEQLRAAVAAVFDSWDSPRAVAYRAHHDIHDLRGTAVTVQAMAFGNRDDASGTGVLFSRSPVDGAPALYGEWLPRAQGEDVVSGERTPQALSTLAEAQPDNHARLVTLAADLEREYRDMVDVEFTIESGTLYVLQARVGKRTAEAAAAIAVALADEGLVDRATAVRRISPSVAERLAESVGAAGSGEVLARGTAAGPGVGVGRAISSVDDALDAADRGESVVLVRPSTSPEDVPAMFSAVAVVTELGGSTSHAALVCREAGIPCVVGCGEGIVTSLEGRVVTVDGSQGAVFAESLDADAATSVSPAVATLTTWAADVAGHDGTLLELVSELADGAGDA